MEKKKRAKKRAWLAIVEGLGAVGETAVRAAASRTPAPSGEDLAGLKKKPTADCGACS